MVLSLSRYLWTRVVVPGIIINVIINAWIGRLVHPIDIAVPLAGGAGIAGDTVVNAFVIGFLTLLGVSLGARVEARAGRVRGFGRRADGWLGWPARRPLWAALALGVTTGAVLGLPTVLALQAAGVDQLSRDGFVIFRSAFAAFAGALTGLLAALTAIAVIPAPDDSDARWCRDPARPVDGPVYPCDFLDKGGLAVSDRARGCSGTPTWQLVVRGALEPEHIRRALADVVTRYPPLTTKVQALDGVPEWASRFRWAHDPRFRLDDILEFVNPGADPAAVAEAVRAVHNRHLDLFTDFPMTLTVLRDGAERWRLLFRQHHAVADGRAFIGLLGDFSAFLDAARAGTRPAPAALAPIGRRAELDGFGLSRGRRIAWTAAGIARFLGVAVLRRLRPLTPLVQNRSNDYSGDNGTVHWALGDEALERWNLARKRLGVSLNSFLTGALLAANRRWHDELGAAVGRTRATLAMETRPRSGEFASFANHFATLEVEVALDRVADAGALAVAVHAQVERQRRRNRPVQRRLCERALTRALPLAAMKRFVFDTKRPLYSLDFSNLIAMPLPPLGGSGWAVEELLITTPVAPRIGVMVSAVRLGGRLVFNFNFKASAVTRAQTEQLCRHFQAVLAELAPLPSPTASAAPHLQPRL